jgi:hypothetical protein
VLGLGRRVPGYRSFTEDQRLERVTSVAEAQMNLPFPVREPKALGTPLWIAATPREKLLSGHPAVLFRFRDPALGAVTVMEQGAGVVTIRGGIQAMIQSFPQTLQIIRWIDNGVLFTVISQSMSREQLLAMVEKI